MAWTGQNTATDNWAGQVVSVGGTTSDAVVFAISGATQANPSSILGSVTQSGDDITVTTSANTISNDPSTAVSWERTLLSIFGTVEDFDLGDIFRAIVRVAVLAPPTDLWVGMSIESADGQTGAAFRIAAVSSDWVGQHAQKTTGTWGAWTSGTGLTTTQGFEGTIGFGNGNTQARIGTTVLDALGARTGSGNTAPSSSNIGSNLTRLKLCVGYVAGGLGTPGAITFKAGHIQAKILEWSSFARFFL